MSTFCCTPCARPGTPGVNNLANPTTSRYPNTVALDMTGFSWFDITRQDSHFAYPPDCGCCSDLSAVYHLPMWFGDSGTHAYGMYDPSPSDSPTKTPFYVDGGGGSTFLANRVYNPPCKTAGLAADDPDHPPFPAHWSCADGESFVNSFQPFSLVCALGNLVFANNSEGILEGGVDSVVLAVIQDLNAVTYAQYKASLDPYTKRYRSFCSNHTGQGGQYRGGDDQRVPFYQLPDSITLSLVNTLAHTHQFRTVGGVEVDIGAQYTCIAPPTITAHFTDWQEYPITYKAFF